MLCSSPRSFDIWELAILPVINKDQSITFNVATFPKYSKLKTYRYLCSSLILGHTFLSGFKLRIKLFSRYSKITDIDPQQKSTFTQLGINLSWRNISDREKLKRYQSCGKFNCQLRNLVKPNYNQQVSCQSPKCRPRTLEKNGRHL